MDGWTDKSDFIGLCLIDVKHPKTQKNDHETGNLVQLKKKSKQVYLHCLGLCCPKI